MQSMSLREPCKLKVKGGARSAACLAIIFGEV